MNKTKSQRSGDKQKIKLAATGVFQNSLFHNRHSISRKLRPGSYSKTRDNTFRNS